jgi:hypothetical protein
MSLQLLSHCVEELTNTVPPEQILDLSNFFDKELFDKAWSLWWENQETAWKHLNEFDEKTHKSRKVINGAWSETSIGDVLIKKYLIDITQPHWLAKHSQQLLEALWWVFPEWTIQIRVKSSEVKFQHFLLTNNKDHCYLVEQELRNSHHDTFSTYTETVWSSEESVKNLIHLLCEAHPEF